MCAAARPQPRPKAELRKTRTGKALVHIYTPTHYKGADGKRHSNGVQEWRDRVASAGRRAIPAPLAGPLEIQITVYLERPKRLDTKRGDPGAVRCDRAVGDADNYAKAILDALHDVAFTNDAQVSDLIVRKRYAAAGCATGAKIVVRSIAASAGLFADSA